MILDIVIGIIIIINLLLGLKRGLLVMLGKLVLLVLIVAVVLIMAGPLTDVLSKAPFLAPLAEKIGDSVLKPLTESAANIGTAIESFGIPKFLADLLQSQLPTPDNSVTEVFPEFSEVLFKFLLNAIVFVLMFIIVVVVITVLTKALTRAADKVPIVGAGNRFGGLLVGAAIGILQVSIILLVLGFLSPVWQSAAGWIEDSKIARLFFEFDILALIF